MALDLFLRRRVYREVLGIETGDQVRTSYDTGPYEVWAMIGPEYWELDYSCLCVRDYPVVSLILVDPGVIPTQEHELRYINEIRREGTEAGKSEAGEGLPHRYFSGDDEIFVQKPESRPPMEMPDLLDSGTPEPNESQPYPFQEGVDYRAGDGRVFHCPECRRDFNDEEREGSKPPPCPGCGLPALDIIAFFDPPESGA